jgi:Ca2+/Na+ antiporter
MDILRDITLILHFLGLAMILGPFFIQMRSHTNFAFGWVLTGALLQLVTGVGLTGLAEMRLADEEISLNYAKISVKLGITLVIFLIALSARRRQRKVSPTGNQRALLPLLHTTGLLGLSNVVMSVVWTGVVS